MKKTYINPDLEVVRLTSRQSLLAESQLDIVDDFVNPGAIDGHESDFDWNDSDGSFELPEEDFSMSL